MPQARVVIVASVAAARRIVSVLAIVTALTLSVGDAWAAPVADDLDIKRSSQTGLATFVTAKNKGPMPVAAAQGGAVPQPMDIVAEYGPLFGVKDPAQQLVLSKSRQDDLGHTHTTYDQVWQGVRVFSGVLKVHQNAAGQMVAANGHFHPIPETLTATPTLSSAEAEAVAKATAPGVEFSIEHSELVVVDPGWYGDPPIGAKLAYYITIFSASPTLIDEGFFIDAQTGAILDRWNLIQTARDRQIYNANGTYYLPGTLARAEGQGPNADTDVNRAYDYAGDAYDYFYRAFGRDGLDGVGGALTLSVNYFYPDWCPNAGWSRTLEQTAFCTNTVADDVVTHELTHGLTQYTADLIYQDQPGQLNESFSDVFGEMVDLFNGNAAFPGTPGGTPSWPSHPTGPGTDIPNNLRTSACSTSPDYADGVRWLCGEDATAFPERPLRDMWNPPCKGDPDRGNSLLQTCDPNDNGGVHSGSGIPNHAFAMLTDGKTFNGYTVTGIGPIKAAAVWYRALTTYLTTSSDFKDAYNAFNQAAADLIGTYPNDPRTGSPSADAFTSADALQVDHALLATEMNVDGPCGSMTDGLLTITAITPNTAPNLGSVQITDLAGTGFESGATVKLTKDGQSIIATSVTVVSSTQITCTFRLTGVDVGAWNVIVANSSRQSSGILTDCFTVTASPPGFLVESPDGNETWAFGSAHNIVWESLGCGSTVNIDLLKNGSVHSRIASGVPNTGTFNWTVPLDLPEDTDYRIRITDCDNANYTDESDADFSILPTSCPRVYVDVSRLTSGDGRSWGTAYNNLQEALTYASAHAQESLCCEIRVAEGTYTPGLPGNRSATFGLCNWTVIYGGFPTGGGTWAERDPAANQTILSGDLAGNDGPNFANNAENSYHVVTGGGTDATAVLDGFAIKGGNADVSPDAYGGGIYVVEGSPTISNCIVESNKCAYHGAGAYCQGTWATSISPSFTACTFSENDAGSSGGGMHAFYAVVVFDHCRFENNHAYSGGGLYYQQGAATLADCFFSGNMAEADGGGMSVLESSLTATRCHFVGNGSTNMYFVYGGGLFVSCGLAQPADLVNCVFAENRAPGGGYGGGLYAQGPGFRAVNCVFSDNQAAYGGGASCEGWTEHSHAFVNCTFTDNAAASDTLEDESGGGIFVVQDSYPVELTNCVIWSNTSSPVGEPQIQGSATVNYSCIQDEVPDDIHYPGTGNIDDDPRFADQPNGKYQLAGDSPCLDTGYNDVPDLPTTDLTNRPRIVDGNLDNTPTVDMGAYEAAVHRVGSGQTHTTIQPAIDAALDGDIVAIAGGTYSGAGNRDLTVNNKVLAFRRLSAVQSVTIRPLGWTSTARAFVFNNAGSSMMIGLTIMNALARADNGGAVKATDSSLTIRNCSFSYNRTGAEATDNTACDGAAVYAGGGTLVMENCHLFSNTAGWNLTTHAAIDRNGSGGAMAVDNTTLQLVNCTINGNKAPNDRAAGVLASNGSGVSVVDSVLWGNTRANGTPGDQIAIETGSTIDSLTYSCVQGATPDPVAHLINQDPLLSGGRLLPGSPCVDTGDNGAVPSWLTTDLTGRGRKMDGNGDNSVFVDMGAYENATIVAGPPGMGPTLQSAVNSALAGDYILAEAGTYMGSGNVNVTIPKNLVIRSKEGAASTIIDCEGAAGTRAFLVNAPCTIEGFTIRNGYRTDGSAIQVWSPSPYGYSLRSLVRDCILQNNNAGGGNGGAIAVVAGAADIVNCLITANLCGGVMVVGYGSLGTVNVTNCTIADNTCSSADSYNAGGISFRMPPGTGVHTVTNCILWGNATRQIGGPSGVAEVTYSCVQDGWSGTENILLNPLFAAAGDYHLSTSSPCIEAGDDSAVTSGMDTDLDGNDRVVDYDSNPLTGDVDMGAYEYQVP